MASIRRRFFLIFLIMLLAIACTLPACTKEKEPAAESEDAGSGDSVAAVMKLIKAAGGGRGFCRHREKFLCR